MNTIRLLRVSLMILAMVLVGASMDVLAKQTDEQNPKSTKAKESQVMSTELDQPQDVDLPKEEQIQVLAEEYNEKQEEDTARIVCKKEAQTGTRIKKTVCRTVGTMKAEHEHAKHALDHLKPSLQNKD